MARVRRINVSQIEGDNANNNIIGEIRPFGEIALYLGDNNKLELLIADGQRTNVRNKVLNKGTFYGGDADSSDGLNRDTIKLVPDEELRRNGSDQYLIIDPTFGEPGHIHIRAGGAIDNSTADLFLGGEVNNVRVSDVYNSVSITSFAGFDNITYTWNFNTNGDLVFPGSSNAKIGDDEPGLVVFSDNGFAVQTNANSTSSQSWIFDNTGALRLPRNATIENTASVQSAGTIITVPLNAAGDTEDYVGGASVLEVPTNGDTDQVQPGWIITFTGGITRTIAYIGRGGGYTSLYYNDANPGLGSSTYPLTIQSPDYTLGSNGNVSISLENSNNTTTSYVFDADGTLDLPSNLSITPAGNFAPIAGTAILQSPTESLIMVTSGEGGNSQIGWTQNLLSPGKTAMVSFNAANSNSVDIVTGDFTGTVHTWIFGADGITQFPDGTTSTGSTVFATSSSYKIQTISFDGSPSNVVSTYEFGVGSITIPGNGIIKNEGLEGFWALDGFNSRLQFPNLARLGYGLAEALPTEDDLRIFASNTGSIYVSANGTEWTFGNDGNLKLPANGDIVDSNGISQLANRAEGNWTVTTGTNTYSFTVPSDGTYIMWVNGNIPNGIITWNATVSVSNTNVPAIGQQYAWNYTGGGSPLLLTAIPNQIKGTAGTISTDNSYVGTTSNVFAFGISNTSGAEQTVYWGYTKI